MRRRLGLARALAPGPALLLIDEPTSGLDPEERVEFRELLGGLAEVTAVIVSTHIAADVEVSCSRVLVFAAGRIIWDGTPTALLATASGRLRTAEVDDAELPSLAASYRITAQVRQGHRVRVRFLSEPDRPQVGEPCAPTLEEAYLALIGDHGTAHGRPQ
jgi:ABC-2 type transport system ATP-binding protein